MKTICLMMILAVLSIAGCRDGSDDATATITALVSCEAARITMETVPADTEASDGND